MQCEIVQGSTFSISRKREVTDVEDRKREVTDVEE